ncbi:MAG: LLM class flavin-dependent oxidoreductase [Haloplanus sp.]|jgi:alkanesulfonate monooxygenase SsuD/methylene tetrahydromethanopterin reductase-like flavin-dependent oxidoreductase (luciferase family)
MATPRFSEIGIAFEKETPDVGAQVDFAAYAEDQGFDSVWVTETRLVRDAVSILGALTRSTDEMRLGTAVLPMWTRNVALMAQTWSTLFELGGPRMHCGLGAWWDPLAENVGIDRQDPNPLRAMWEYATVLRRLLDLESVTYDGAHIQIEDVQLDLIRADAGKRDVPLYVGATGPQMNEMGGELVGEGVLDGVILNANEPPEYVEDCVDRIEAGVRRRGGTLDDVRRPQTIYVSMDEDADAAIDAVRGVCAQYLAQQAHVPEVARQYTMDPDLVDEIRAELDGWRASMADIERITPMIPDDHVRRVVAAGTPETVVERIHEYVEAGTTEPVLSVLSGNQREVVDVFSEYLPA